MAAGAARHGARKPARGITANALQAIGVAGGGLLAVTALTVMVGGPAEPDTERTALARGDDARDAGPHARLPRHDGAHVGSARWCHGVHLVHNPVRRASPDRSHRPADDARTPTDRRPRRPRPLRARPSRARRRRAPNRPPRPPPRPPRPRRTPSRHRPRHLRRRRTPPRRPGPGRGPGTPHTAPGAPHAAPVVPHDADTGAPRGLARGTEPRAGAGNPLGRRAVGTAYWQ